MRGTLILLVFFAMFTFAYLVIPYPMFPGNVVAAKIGPEVSEYAWLISALFNAVFYCVVLWLVFVIISSRLKEEK
jgi:hypothetical protein